MPPKKAGNKESKKTVEKKKDKVIEDKTFGLKNKKGAKTQKFIQQVQKQVKGNLPKVSTHYYRLYTLYKQTILVGKLYIDK